MWQLLNPVVKEADFSFATTDKEQTSIFQLWQNDICLSQCSEMLQTDRLQKLTGSSLISRP